MGLPIDRITVATNSNDIVVRAIETGRYAKGQVQATQSPAMDIQIASNFERLYFEVVQRDGVETSRAMRAFAETGAIDLPPRALAQIREVFTGAGVSEAETTRAIVSTLNQTGELVDPHTAVALAAAHRLDLDHVPTVVLSTAHAAKFPEAVSAAAGVDPPLPRSAHGLAAKRERMDHLPADVAAVQAYIRDFAGV
jgi:threonine synthase